MNKKILLFFILFLGIGVIFFYYMEKINIDSNIEKNEKQENFYHQHDAIINSEKDFLVQMIYHHQEAVDAAQKVLQNGGTVEEVKKIASNIIATQKDEIEIMKTWYQQWFKENLPPKTVYKPMMRSLENLKGKELDKQFLEDMIIHHQGAIIMAQQIKNLTENKEIQNLIDKIINIQTEEIKKMETILREKF